MNEVEIRSALASLKCRKRKWKTVLPKSAGQFFGEPIRIEIYVSVRVKRTEKPDKAVLALLENILTKLPSVITRAVARFTEPYASIDDEEYTLMPHIWIDENDVSSGQIRKWAFVVGLKNDDAAWHIEFSGNRLLRMWGGG